MVGLAWAIRVSRLTAFQTFRTKRRIVTSKLGAGKGVSMRRQER